MIMVRTDVPIRLVETRLVEPMGMEISTRALGILARWALRRMEKREGALNEAVSNDFPRGKTAKGRRNDLLCGGGEVTCRN